MNLFGGPTAAGHTLESPSRTAPPQHGPGLQIICDCGGWVRGFRHAFPRGRSSRAGVLTAWCGGSGFTETGVQAGHVIADPVHGVFYATVGDDAPVHASSLVVVAALGEVVSSVFVGAWPWTMALSDLCESAEPELGGAADLVSPDGKTLAFVGFGGNFDAPPRLFVFANPFEGE